MRLLALFIGALLAFAAAAEPGAARYAGTQLQVAHENLQLARAAAAAGDRARAALLARQAILDARLTWAMSDAAPLRADAEDVAEDARVLLFGLGSHSLSQQ